MHKYIRFLESMYKLFRIKANDKYIHIKCEPSHVKTRISIGTEVVTEKQLILYKYFINT